MLARLSKKGIREFRQDVVAAAPMGPKPDIDGLRESVGKAEERMIVIVERYGIDIALFDAPPSDPVVGSTSQLLPALADSEAKASMLTRRQVAEY